MYNAPDIRSELMNIKPDHLKKTTPLDISLWELCQNPVVLERENFKMLGGDMLLFWNFLVLKQLDFDKVLMNNLLIRDYVIISKHEHYCLVVAKVPI